MRQAQRKALRCPEANSFRRPRGLAGGAVEATGTTMDAGDVIRLAEIMRPRI
jgi:hypothetical protein